MTKFSTKDKKPSEQDKPRRVKRKTTTRRPEKDDGCCRCMTQYVMLIIMVFGLTLFYLKQYKYNNHYISVSGSGELSVRHFVNDLNAMMCQNYKVSTWKPFNVYLTSGEARIDKENRATVKRGGEQLYPKSMATDNSFYLLEGSNLKVNACRISPRSDSNVHRDSVVDLLIFKGDDAWNTFKSGSCNGCSAIAKSLPLQAYCDEGRNVILPYNVTERDTYYIAVVDRSEGYNTFYLNVRAELEISQTIFNTKDAKRICTQASECLVPLKYDADVDVVLTFTDDTFVTTECKLRVMFCVGIFVVFPACLLIVGFTCCGVCLMLEKQEKKKKKKLTNQLNINTVDEGKVNVKDNSDLLKNELPPSYDSLNHV